MTIVTLQVPCTRCGRGTHVEELGPASGSMWLHCHFCGHLWRRMHPSADVFSLILSHKGMPITPLQEATPPDGVARALRFVVQLGIQYRSVEALKWSKGSTVNVSRSGLLFKPTQVVIPDTSVDIILTVPGAVAGEPTSRLRCRGQIVRSWDSVESSSGPTAAAAIEDYELAGG